MIIDFSLILKSIPYVLSGLPYIYLRNLSFELYHWKLFCYSSCRYADVTKALVKVSSPYLHFIYAWGSYVGRALHSLLWPDLCWHSDTRPSMCHNWFFYRKCSAAYMAEIFRSSISAVDKGQWEAAQSLGLPQKPIIRHIILPQALRIAVAPLAMSLLIWLRVPHWLL